MRCNNITAEGSKVENKGILERPKPSAPYRPVQSCLTVPALAISETLALLKREGQRESCVFWFGPRDAGGDGSIAYVIAPKQLMNPLNYSVPTASMTEMSRRLRPGWRPLAQIHSHPGSDVEHSNYDDEMASSRNALSLVIPCYGWWSSSFPDQIGVHEWQNDYWHLLNSVQAHRRVKLGSGNVLSEDLR